MRTHTSTCSALKSPRGWMLVDPIPLKAVALAELISTMPVAGIVLTNGNHQRSAAEYREKFSKYALTPDTAKRNSYYKPLPALPVRELAKKSAVRVIASNEFPVGYADHVQQLLLWLS